MIQFVLSLLLATSFASELPHLDLELSGQEYRALLESREPLNVRALGASFQDILNTGKRNLDWLEFINARRTESQRLSFTSAATQVGYPVESPKESNPALIRSAFESVRAEMPVPLKSVIFDGKGFTAEAGVSDSVYIEWGLRLDRVYQSASRWLLQEPYLFSYAARRKTDIRGYYFLSREPDLTAKLNGWVSLPAEDQARLRPWLIGECINSGASESSCAAELSRATTVPSQALRFHQKYLPGAQSQFESFFKIQNARRDVRWTSQSPSVMSLPFVQPNTNEIYRFLADNIEDEWRWADSSLSWVLKLDFTPQSPFGTTRVVFEPGATPHVNGIGGSTITMDANQPLTEYGAQWTIRHEFGHVLGFPDCYIEFYDTQREVMVSYQIDVTNLMCSRKGHLQRRHFDDLKRAYYR